MTKFNEKIIELVKLFVSMEHILIEGCLPYQAYNLKTVQSSPIAGRIYVNLLNHTIKLNVDNLTLVYNYSSTGVSPSYISKTGLYNNNDDNEFIIMKEFAGEKNLLPESDDEFNCMLFNKQLVHSIEITDKLQLLWDIKNSTIANYSFELFNIFDCDENVIDNIIKMFNYNKEFRNVS